MGRMRKTLRWTFSFGGTGLGSPIAKESDRTMLMREQNRLIRIQNELLDPTPKPPMPIPQEITANGDEEYWDKLTIVEKAKISQQINLGIGKSRRAKIAAKYIAKSKKEKGESESGLTGSS